MCLAIPMRTVELGGVEQTVNLTFTPDVTPGEYVIVHAGFALERLNEEEARHTIALLNELTGNTDAP